MVKECDILINNDYVTVVRFNKTEVQLPAIKTKNKRVCVAYEDGKYFVVDKNYYEKNKALETKAIFQERKSKSTTKKTSSRKKNKEENN